MISSGTEVELIHLTTEAAVAALLVLGGLGLLAAQARRNRAELRALLDQQSESLAFQADLVAARQAASRRERGTIPGLRIL